MDQVAGDQRHQRLNGDCGEAEHRAAHQHDADFRRHGDIADARRHGAPSGSGGRTLRRRSGPPSRQDDDQPDIADRIDRESRERAGGRDDHAADGRSDAARELKPMLLRVMAAGRSDRGTISPTNDCHAGPLKAVPHPTRKVKNKQQPRRHETEIGAQGKRDRHAPAGRPATQASACAGRNCRRWRRRQARTA